MRHRARGGPHRRIRRRDRTTYRRTGVILAPCTGNPRHWLRHHRPHGSPRATLYAVGRTHRECSPQGLPVQLNINGLCPMRKFMLPDLGEGLEEAEIVTWYVNEGDHVVTDQPLVSVETDKAVVEIPSPSSGRIAHLFGTNGDIVKVGTPLVEFAEGAEQDTGTIVGELGGGEHPPATAVPSARAAGLEPQVFPAVRTLA